MRGRLSGRSGNAAIGTLAAAVVLGALLCMLSAPAASAARGGDGGEADAALDVRLLPGVRNNTSDSTVVGTTTTFRTTNTTTNTTLTTTTTTATTGLCTIYVYGAPYNVECDEQCGITVDDTYINCDTEQLCIVNAGSYLDKAPCVYTCGILDGQSTYIECPPPGNLTCRLNYYNTPFEYACNDTSVIVKVPGCAPCDAGSYDDDGGDDNSSSTTNDAGACSDCPQGHCSSQDLCVPCSAGSSTAGEKGQQTCRRCSIGYYAPSAGSPDCQPCDPGFESDANRTACAQCTPGFYNPQAGGACLGCPPGTFSDVNEAVECAPCQPGWANPFYEMDHCSQCNPGEFAGDFGEPVCEPCGAGSYSSTLAADECTECPEGYYCASETTSAPQICPADSYCPEGTGEPLSCGTLFGSEEGATGCTANVGLYIIIVFLAVAVLTTLAYGYTWYNRRGRGADEKQRLIPQPDSGPVYSGL